MKSIYENNILTIFPTGRLDALHVEAFEKEITEKVNEFPAEKLILDMTDLEYIASAGLRVLLKIGKTKKLSLINVSREVYEVLDMTGFTDMFETRRIMREISLEGCKIIGAGLSSNVYRYDRETVVKLYSERITLDRIYNETASAKRSFVAGIPTAIPYDVVRSGKCYGTVYELIDADTLSQNFMNHPERFDELMDKYVALLKQFHATPAKAGTFPNIRDKYHTWSAGLKKYLTPEEISLIDRMIDAVPERSTMIHVDCHSRNIMVQGEKLIFVDMADVSIGHPLFDIGAEYFHYIFFNTCSLGSAIIFGKEPDDPTLPSRVWNGLVRRYFADADEETLQKIHRMLKLFGGLRCLIMVAKHSQLDAETAMEFVGRQRAELFPFAEEAIQLFSEADTYFKKE